MIEARLPAVANAPPAGLIAMGAAAGQLAMLRMWLVGEASCPAATLARQFLAATPAVGGDVSPATSDRDER